MSRIFSGDTAQLCYLGQVLMENRNWLVVGVRLTQAKGTAEWESALELVQNLPAKGRITLGGDKKYDTRDGVDGAPSLNVTPHVAQNDTDRNSAIDRRTTHHAGYAVSQVKRKRV